MALATVAQVDAIIGSAFDGSGSPEEARIVELIALAQATIEDELGRPAEGGAELVELVHVGAWRQRILLDRWPVEAVATVKDNTTTPTTTLAAGDYVVDLANGIISRRVGNVATSWAPGLQAVEVTYTPATIRSLSTLCATITARAYRASVAAAAPAVANMQGLRQLVVGRWSATADSSERSDPVRALQLTDAENKMVRAWADRLP